MTFMSWKISISYKKYNLNYITKGQILLAIMFFSLIIGCRYMVGIDYESYLYEYSYFFRNGYTTLLGDRARWEVIPDILTRFLAGQGIHFSIFFIIIAFLQISFFYKSLINNVLIYLLPFATFFLITTQLGSMVNVMRQFIAIMIFIYSLKFVRDRCLYKYIICIILAFLFHKSVIVCLPVYFFINKELFRLRFIQIVLIIISFVIGHIILSFLWSNFSILFIGLGYDSYSSIEEGSGAKKLEINSGLGTGLIWAINILIIYYYPKLKEKYAENGFLIFYNLFFIGLILKPIFDTYMVLNRINNYFYSFRFIIMAFLCHYLLIEKVNNKNAIIGKSLIIISLIVFYYEISVGASGMAPFQFFWDN